MKDTLNFDFKTGDFVIENGDVVVLSGADALKLWITKILHTQLNRYPIYKSTSYGVGLEDLVIGKSYSIDFVESEVKREIENALLQNEDIYSIEKIVVIKTGTRLTIDITLNTAYGVITEELAYDN